MMDKMSTNGEGGSVVLIENEEPEDSDACMKRTTATHDALEKAPACLLWLDAGEPRPSLWAVASIASALATGRRVFVCAGESLFSQQYRGLYPVLRHIINISGCETRDDALKLSRLILENDPRGSALGIAHCSGWKMLDILGRCESPIELRLAVHLYCRIEWGYELEAQVQVETDAGSYRLDLAVQDERTEHANAFKLAIECDGHDFHERTKQQAQRDKVRDRALIRDGWTVLRFTGSEIWNEPEKCTTEVEQMIQNLSGVR